MARPSPYIIRTSAIFSQQEDKSEPAARRPQASCPSFRLYLYGIDYPQVHRPFRKNRQFFNSLFTNTNCHSATGSASSVIPGFLRFKARCIGWHPCVILAAKPIPHRVLSVHRLTDAQPSIAASGRAVPFAANDSATRVCCWRFPPPLRTSLYASRSSRWVSSPVRAEHFPAPRSTGVLCSSSWPQAWFRYGIFKVQCQNFLPYLNHAYDPAFAVHRCTSPMLSQQGDRSEPAPVGNRLPAPAYARSCTGLITCAFTDHSEIQNRISHSALRLLDQLLPLYPDFSGSRHVALGGIPVSYRRPSQYPAGFFPHTG